MADSQTTECWCMACNPVSGEIGLECKKSKTTCPNCHGEGAIVTVGGSRNTCEECFGTGHTGSPFAPRETDIPEYGGKKK